MYKIIGGDQKEYGPVDFEQLAAWVRENRANAQTLIQKEGGPWLPLGSLPEFAALLSDQRPAEASAPGTGASPLSQPGTVPMPDGPGGTPGSVPGQGGYSNLPPSPAMGPAMGGGWPGAPYGQFERAQTVVQAPAIALMVTGILGAVFVVIGLIFGLMGAAFPQPQGNIPPELQQWFDMAQRLQSPAVVIIDAVIKLAIAGLTVYGAQKMRVLESFPLVVTATILTMIPCTSPCCCIGIPIGIWALVVLFKPEVRSAFR